MPEATTLNITDTVRGPIPPRVDNATWPGVLHTRIEDVVRQMGEPPWSKRLIFDERNMVTLIANNPGTGNRPHWHADFDEWWVVMAGELQWEYTGGRTVRAKKGDIVWVPRGSVHHIMNVGDGLSLRLAVAMPPAIHYAETCEACGFSQDGPAEFGSTPSPDPDALRITDVVKGPIPPRVDNPVREDGGGWPGVLHTQVAQVTDLAGPPPWAKRLITDERNIVTLIANAPGTGNRPHWHSDFDEWWVVMGGALQWEYTGGRKFVAHDGDVVWVPRGTVHHIQNVGDGLSLRLAVAMPPAAHIYNDCDECGYTDDGPRQWEAR